MYNFYTLKNGLRVVTEKVDGVNSISVGVMIQNGSRNETPEVNGISHFIEHMFFKGTDKRNAKEIVESIENIGGQINAFTSKESTCYYVKNLYTHLDLSLEVLSDMILNAKFDSEEIEREKGVVIEEINMNEDNPEDVLEDLHSRACFGDNSLAYPILGSIDRVKSFTRDKIKKFINDNYTPYNTVISICGKFDEDNLKELVEKYFGEWKCSNIYIPTYSQTEIAVNSNHSIKEIEQLHVSLGLKGLPFGHEKGYALVLLSNIFGGGASSILFQKVREQLGLCYSIYCYPQTYQGAGVLNIYAGLGKNYGEKALEAIKYELNEFVKSGISKEMLEINKEKIKTNYILGLESTSSRMFSNAKSALFKNRVTTQDEVIEKVDRINLEDIDYVMKECFSKGVLNSSYVGQSVDSEKLNSIILECDKAYNNKMNSSKIEL